VGVIQAPLHENAVAFQGCPKGSGVHRHADRDHPLPDVRVMASDSSHMPGVGRTLTPPFDRYRSPPVALARFPIGMSSKVGSAATRSCRPSTPRDLGVVETRLLKLW